MNLEFTKMKYRVDLTPPIEIPELLSIFKDFAKYKTEHMSNEQILKYIVYCYHRKSPFIASTEHLLDRKREILDYLKVRKTTNDNYHDDVQAIIKNTDERVCRAICLFLRYEDNINYYTYVQTLEAFYNLNDQLAIGSTSAKDGKDVADIIIKLEKVDDRLAKLANRLSVQDASVCEVIGSMQKDIERKIRIFPEDYALG